MVSQPLDKTHKNSDVFRKICDHLLSHRYQRAIALGLMFILVLTLIDTSTTSEDVKSDDVTQSETEETSDTAAFISTPTPARSSTSNGRPSSVSRKRKRRMERCA